MCATTSVSARDAPDKGRRRWTAERRLHFDFSVPELKQAPLDARLPVIVVFQPGHFLESTYRNSFEPRSWRTRRKRKPLGVGSGRGEPPVLRQMFTTAVSLGHRHRSRSGLGLLTNTTMPHSHTLAKEPTLKTTDVVGFVGFVRPVQCSRREPHSRPTVHRATWRRR